MAVFVDSDKLKKDTSKILKHVAKEPAIITRNGSPCAALVSIKEQELDDFLWEVSPRVQQKIRQGFKEMKNVKGINLKKFVKKYGLA